MRVLFTLVLFFIIFSSFAQVGLSKRVLKQLEKGNLEKSTSLVEKAMAKDSLLPAALYAKSRVLLDTLRDRPNIDSAYHYVLSAQKQWALLDEKEKTKHSRKGIDSVLIGQYKQKIDSIAFQRAIEANNEKSFAYFIDHFNSAGQVPEAKERRNALAFANAKEKNTYQSYQDFINRYPEATQLAEARRRYEKLYFDKRTVDGKLSSYIQFVKDHPETPYRIEAEKNIFEIMTADHAASSYRNFIHKFPKSMLKDQAVGFLYHALKEQGETIDRAYVTDSLAAIIKLESKGVIPVWKDGKYGFIDTEGKVVISPKYSALAEGEICGGITRDYLLIANMIMGLNEAPIYRGGYDEVRDLGSGMLQVTYNGRSGVMHKSGREILPIAYQEIRLLLGKFLIYKINDRWGMVTAAGRQMTNVRFTDISTHGPFIIFERNDQIDVKNEETIIRAANNNPLKFDGAYNDYELVGDQQLWLSTPEGETLVDQELNEIIPLASQRIKVRENAVVINKENLIYILNKNYRPLEKEPALHAAVSRAWVALKMKDNWGLYDLNANALRDRELDSVALLGNHFAVAYRNDSTAIITKDRPWLLAPNEEITLISGMGAEQYLLIKNGRYKRVINPSGKEIFRGRIDEVKSVGEHYLVITQAGKKGMISGDAEALLPMVYEAIGNYNKGYVSLLKNKKFGLYSQYDSVFIPAEYDKNLTNYNQHFFIADQGGQLGLVNKLNEKYSDFEYDEVKYWSDSVALMKKDEKWMLYHIFNQEVESEGIRSIQMLGHNVNEILAVILKDSGYGVLSSTRGEVIAPTYNDIVNIGSLQTPVYFTEKHVSEAGIYVVIYYNAQGELIRKQVLEGKDYMSIYCDDY